MKWILICMKMKTIARHAGFNSESVDKELLRKTRDSETSSE